LKFLEVVIVLVCSGIDVFPNVSQDAMLLRILAGLRNGLDTYMGYVGPLEFLVTI